LLPARAWRSNQDRWREIPVRGAHAIEEPRVMSSAVRDADLRGSPPRQQPAAAAPATSSAAANNVAATGGAASLLRAPLLLLDDPPQPQQDCSMPWDLSAAQHPFLLENLPLGADWQQPDSRSAAALQCRG
jgi:hypothetical protein